MKLLSRIAVAAAAVAVYNKYQKDEEFRKEADQKIEQGKEFLAKAYNEVKNTFTEDK